MLARRSTLVWTLSLAAALALTAPTLSGCGSSATTEPAPEGIVLARSDVVVVGEDRIASGPRLAGTLEPFNKAVIRAEASGSVTEIAAEIGEQVTQGQLLGKIEASATGDQWRSAKSGLVSAEQDLKMAERDLERTRRLAEAGALSPRDLELSQSQYASTSARLDAARAQVTSAGTQLGRTTLKSPIAGVVSERAVSMGDVVSPGAPMFTVIDPSSLRLEGSVPAAAVGALSVGTPVTFEVQGYAGRTFTGTIDRISPAVDPVSRQIPLIVSIPNAEGTLVAGLFAEGRVASEQRDGLVVPADAVDTTGPVPVVYTVDHGVVNRVEVELGLRDEAQERVEIVSGVERGAVLILGGARDVEPGTPARIDGVQAAGAAGDGAEG